MSITIKAEGSEAVRAQLARIGAPMGRQALAATAVEVEDYIARQAAVHHQKGALVRSIYKERQGEDAWIIGHDLQVAPHALFVHWGTKAHIIRPKNKKALRWAAGGKFFFAQKVRHPGNKPDKWLERAAALAPALFAQHIQTQLKNLS